MSKQLTSFKVGKGEWVIGELGGGILVTWAVCVGTHGLYVLLYIQDFKISSFKYFSLVLAIWFSYNVKLIIFGQLKRSTTSFATYLENLCVDRFILKITPHICVDDTARQSFSQRCTWQKRLSKTTIQRSIQTPVNKLLLHDLLQHEILSKNVNFGGKQIVAIYKIWLHRYV